VRLDHLLSKEHAGFAAVSCPVLWGGCGGGVQGHCPDACSGVVAHGWNVDCGWCLLWLVLVLLSLRWGWWGWNVLVGWVLVVARCWVLRERAPAGGWCVVLSGSLPR
jgi:hypothetical protein